MAAVVDEIVGIPASPPRSHLSQPRPYCARGTADRDGVIHRSEGVSDQVIAVQRHRPFRLSGANLEIAEDEECGHRGQCCGRDNDSDLSHGNCARDDVIGYAGLRWRPIRLWFIGVHAFIETLSFLGLQGIAARYDELMSETSAVR